MGRGRAKAKQTKVARQLKYSSPDMDLESLQRERSTESGHSTEDDYEEWDDWSAEEDEGR